MDLFRVVEAPFADLSGEGGLHASGRWHTRGRPVVYTSESRALAILERLVHTDPEDVPDGLVLLRITVPDDLPVEEVDAATLAGSLREVLHPACRARGDGWLSTGRTPVLKVPSVVVPDEFNFVINPLHSDTRRIAIRDQQDFAFDARLL